MAQIYANGSKNHHKFTLDVTENSTSIADNTSTLSFTFKLSPVQKGWDWSGWGSSISYTVNIGSNEYTGTIPSYNGSSTVTLKSGDNITIEHESDGTKTIDISFSVTDSTGQSYTCGNASKSGTMVLSTIPRTTECPNLDGYIESGAIIALNPASTSFKHRIYYSYNGKTGYYPSSATFFTDTGTLPLDTSFYSYTPKSSGTGDITLYTYTSDGTLIGSDTGTITVRCDEDKCKPIIDADIIDVNSTTTALTGNNKKLVKGYSTAQITYTITPLNGASISSKTVNSIPLQTSPHEISNVSTGSFKIVATDSRGFPTTETYTNTLVNYIPFTLDFTAFRPTPTGSAIAVNFKGNYFDRSFGSVSNTISLSWKYRLKGNSSWINGGTFTYGTDYTISENKFTSNGDIILSDTLFPYENNYEIAIYYSDKLINTSTYKGVPKGKPVLNWEDDLVNVNGVLTINDKSVGDGLKVSVTEPENKEKVWIRKSKNSFNINGDVNRYCNNGVQVSGGNTVSGNVLTATANTYYSHNIGQKFTNLKGKTFTVSAKVVSVGTGNNGYLAIYENYSQVKGVGATVGEIAQLTYTGTSDNIIIGFATGSGENAQFTDIQVELGNTRTNFEPHVDTERTYILNDNNIYEQYDNTKRNIMCAYLMSRDTTITTDASQRARIPLNGYYTTGNKLSFSDSGNGVVIGGGISKVSITANVSYKHDNSFSIIAICIYKNGDEIAQRIEDLDNTARDYMTLDIELPCVPVVKGDVIRLLFRTVASTNKDVLIRWGYGSTQLTVEVIEE